jgi:hypothetical protein
MYSVTCVLQAAFKYGSGDILPPPFFHPLPSSLGGISPHAVPTHLSKLPPKTGLNFPEYMHNTYIQGEGRPACEGM